jgi:hypothetical protein
MPLWPNVTGLLPLCRLAETASLHHRIQMAMRLTTQEAVMGQVIPRQHPAVVLRSQYKTVLALLCVACVAIVALATAVVIVANDDDSVSISAQPQAQAQQNLPPGTRFDGGPDEGTRGIQVAPAQPLPPGTRFDGGPDEGTRGATSYWQTSNPRSSYQPVPDEGFKARAGGPSMLPTGPSEESQPQEQQSLQPQQHPGVRP